MTLTKAQRRRKNGKNSVRHRAWYREVRTRIAAGEEHCRRCGLATRNLVLAHKIANTLGGNFSRANLVILCWYCDQKNGNRPITDLPTLADEMPTPEHLFCHSRTTRAS